MKAYCFVCFSISNTGDILVADRKYFSSLRFTFVGSQYDLKNLFAQNLFRSISMRNVLLCEMNQTRQRGAMHFASLQNGF